MVIFYYFLFFRDAKDEADKAADMDESQDHSMKLEVTESQFIKDVDSGELNCI